MAGVRGDTIAKAEYGTPGVLGRWGDYRWLSSVDHEISTPLRLSPDVVFGKRLAVTSNDSGTLKLTQSDKEMEWWIGFCELDGILYTIRLSIGCAIGFGNK